MLLVLALVCAPMVNAQVRLLESKASASGFATLRPPGPGEPLGTESCGQTSTPIASDSVGDSEVVTCGVANEFGGGAFSSEYLLDIDDTQGTVSEIFISAKSSCDTDPFVPPTFRQSTNRADGGAIVTVDVEVLSPILATFTFTGAVDENVASPPPDSIGSGFGIGTSSASLRSPLLCNQGINCTIAFQNCLSTETGPCQDDLLPQSTLLEPGLYRFEVQSNVRSESSSGFFFGLAADASASASLLIQFESQAECDLTWSESGSTGAFDDAENWSPQQVPGDDNSGCNDLLLNRPGAYVITFGSGAKADSINVLQGEPTLQGGSLSLAGFDDTALRVSGDASMKIGGGLTSDDIAVEGTALLSNAGQLTIDVLNDISLATLADSDVAMLLAAGGEPAGDSVNFTVGANWTVGDAGRAAATLQGQTTANVNNLRLGAQTTGAGILNVVEGASLNVSEELRVGLAGVGTMNVNTQGEVSADTLVVGAATESEPSLLSVGAAGSLTVATALESGRAASERGEIRIGDLGAEAPSVVSVVGDMTLAGAGDSLLSGAGPLQLDVLGDLSMAVFPGSDSSLVLGVISDEPSDDGEPTDAANLVVAGTWTVGGAGAAAATLADQTDATVKALRLGQLGDGIGILNVTEGASLEVTEDALVGGAGVGTLNISNVGTFSAVNLTVDGAAGEEISGLRLSGESGGVPAVADIAFNLVVGNTTRGIWNMEGSTRLDAGIITMGSAAGSTGSATLVGSPEITESGLLTVKVSAAESIFVGLDGSGSFASVGSADQQFGEMTIGVNQGATGSYLASGALNFTTIQQDLIVGGAGSGDLELRAGGITTAACILGAQNGGFGAVRAFEGGALVVESPSTAEGETEGEGKGAEKTSISFPGFLEIGRKANGIVELFDAGTRLACDEIIIGGDNSAAGGTLNVDTGATVECGVSLTLGANDGPGLVRVADGATMSVGSSIIIGPEGLFIAGGFASINSNNAVVNGRLRVLDALRIERPGDKGDSVESRKGDNGPTIIDANLEVGSVGTLEVVAGEGEVLVVTGAATLDGTLEITLQPGSTLTEGQLLDLIDFQGGVTGSFASVTFGNAPSGFEGDIEFDGGALRLRVITGGIVDPEGESESEGEVEGEGEGEGEGEPAPSGGCQGCNGAGGSAEKVLGDWLVLFLGLTAMLGTHLLMRSQFRPAP